MIDEPPETDRAVVMSPMLEPIALSGRGMKRGIGKER